MDKLKVAVIGVGHLGSKHLKVYKDLPDQAEVIGICDIKEDRTQRLASHYNVPVFSDYTELLDQADAVSICVPTESHHEVAMTCLEKGVHTLVEKPIAPTVEQAREMTALANQKGLILQVGHVERFNSAFESIKKFTTDPLFIEVHRLNHFPNRSLDIGVVMDLMIHDIDIVLGTVHSKIKDIQATGVNVLTPLEDIASVRITFENDCVCNLTASRISDDVMRKIRIFQKDTYISLDYVQQEAFIYKKTGMQILKHSLPIEKEEPLKKELSHFLDCVKSGQSPLVSGKEATEALDVALTITDKIWKRTPQNV